MLYPALMTKEQEALLMTIAYQRQNELNIAVSQLDQATQISQDPKEREFQSNQRGQMAYMHQELSEKISAVEKS